MLTFNILDFGAVADGATDDAQAIQRAIDTCHAAGGGMVEIPAGKRVLAGAFVLRSNIDLHVAEGAVLLSATNIEAFTHRVFEFGPEADKRIWIGCRDAQNIRLSGHGTIDGQCRAFALEENEHIFSKTLRWRPAMTCFENVNGIEVKDLTFRDAANWTLHFTGCCDVDVHDIQIFNNLKFPNADGIDPDHCRRVRISRCHIVSADDCIVLKNTEPFKHYGPCEQIHISDCRLESASAAFKIGSESCNPFRDVIMERCVISRSNRGLAIQLRDCGNVENILFRDIEVETRRVAPCFWGAGEVIYVTAYRRKPEADLGSIKGVRFENIRCTGENGILIYGQSADHIDGVAFSNVTVDLHRTTDWPARIFDIRPHSPGLEIEGCEPDGPDTPWGRVFARDPAAVSIDNATGVSFDQVSVSPPKNDSVEWVAMRSNSECEGAVDFR